jgi:RNA polymerase sigma-70 factor (ECF subfamily)
MPAEPTIDCERDREPRTDGVLLRAARAGDGEAFGLFYRRRRALVLAYLRPRVPEAELAADLLAETFAAALHAVRDAARELPRDPVAWLMTIARNRLIDSVRRGRVEHSARRRLALEPLEIDDGDVRRIEEIVARTDLAARLGELLTPEQHAALAARIFEERDYAEIAGSLRCSEAVVRKRVSRALRVLRGTLEATE